MAKRRLDQLDVAGKRVLVRVDFNVPIDQGIEGISLYDQRLRATLPTIQYLIDRGSKIVLCSHLGRPNGVVVEGLRLAPVGDRLAILLERPVKSLPEITGPVVADAVSAMVPGDIILLENLRFHPGEEENDGVFACELSDTVDCFVMDAFAVAHRAHASTDGIIKFLPSAMGLLVQREVEAMGQALESPERPLAALLGGAKVSDKILLLDNLLEDLDYLVIGGGMCVTFLNAQGYSTGASRPGVRPASRRRQRGRGNRAAAHDLGRCEHPGSRCALVRRDVQDSRALEPAPGVSGGRRVGHGRA